MTINIFLVIVVMNNLQKSPKGSTLRIALGPSSDGKWRNRRSLPPVKDWRTEMTEKIKEKQHEKAPILSNVSTLIQESIRTASHALQLAASILMNLRPCPPQASFQNLSEIHIHTSAPMPYVEIFTSEEIEMEQKWVVPLVSFSEDTC